MILTITYDEERIERDKQKLRQQGWVEIDIGVAMPTDEKADWVGWLNRTPIAMDTVRPWLKQRNIDFRILLGNFFVRRRKATLVRLRWAGQF